MKATINNDSKIERKSYFEEETLIGNRWIDLLNQHDFANPDNKINDNVIRTDQFYFSSESLDILAGDGQAESQSQKLPDSIGSEAFQMALNELTGVLFETNQAEQLWAEILQHKYYLSERLGRNCGIRVAAIDYLTNVAGKMKSPGFREMSEIQRLYKEAERDALTDLNNRRALGKKLDEEIERCRRHGSRFSIAVFDLDDFKKVNDNFGHLVGDGVIKDLASILKESIRLIDFASRWGGEEFVVLMPETEKSDALVVAERIREKFSEKNSDMNLTISGGIAMAPTDGITAHEIFDFADRCLYKAKSEGKNRICLYSNERRKFYRTFCDGKVFMLEKFENKSANNAPLTNVSTGGIAFLWFEPIAVGEMVRGRIKLSERIDGKSESDFFGRVIRVEEIEAGKEYEIGVEFSNSSDFVQKSVAGKSTSSAVKLLL